MLRHIFTLQSKNYAVQFQDRQIWINPSLGRFFFKSANCEKALGGYEYKEEPVGFKHRWRVPLIERDSFWRSKLDAFSSRIFPAGLTRFHPDNHKYMSLKKWFNEQTYEKMVYEQQVIKKRLFILGCDLAAAHFVVYRGGAVKFFNQNNWIKDDKSKHEYDDDLPNVFNPDYILEAIEFTGMPILYEGLKNIENLNKLKWLSFSQCFQFDNWCLDRVAGEHGENLEYLDISFTSVTWHGLNAMYRFKKLKTLKIDDKSEDPEFFQVCLELKNDLPELSIEGISFEFPTPEHKVKTFAT